MNKFYLTIIFSFFILCGNAQSKPDFEKNLEIEHIYGDEAYTVENMLFENKVDGVYGTIKTPNADYLLSSKTKLKNNDIEILNSFLKLAELYKNDCLETSYSSYVQYYTVTKDSQTIKIYKFCDWKNSSYFNIKQKIFGKYLKKLEEQKLKLNNEISVLLTGNWNENISLPELKFDSLYIANKSSDKSSKNLGYIEFNKNQEMILHRKDKKVYYKYKIDVLNGNKYLSIFGDGDKNGDVFVYGHRFLILSLNNIEIKLKRA